MRFRDDDNGTKNPTALLGPDSVGLGLLTRFTRVSDRFNEPNSKCGSALAKLQLAVTLKTRVCA